MSLVSATRRGPEAQLAGLKAFIKDDQFQWKYPPGTGFRGRGVYVSWTHVYAWWQGAAGYGFTAEDIGFDLHDLYDAWHEYVLEKWPGDARNNEIFNPPITHVSPFDPAFTFPGTQYPNSGYFDPFGITGDNS